MINMHNATCISTETSKVLASCPSVFLWFCGSGIYVLYVFFVLENVFSHNLCYKEALVNTHSGAPNSIQFAYTPERF